MIKTLLDYNAWYMSVDSGTVVPSKHKHLHNICTMLDQRRRRWADVVQMLYKYFVFVGYADAHNCTVRYTVHYLPFKLHPL